MSDSTFYHTKIHDILGGLTGVRSACSLIRDDYAKELSPIVSELLESTEKQAVTVIELVKEMRDHLYEELES